MYFEFDVEQSRIFLSSLWFQFVHRQKRRSIMMPSLNNRTLWWMHWTTSRLDDTWTGEINLFLSFIKYCRILFLGRGGEQCSWTVNILLDFGGLNFMGKWFFALQCKTIHYFVIRLWGRNFMGKDNPRNPQTLIVHEQWSFHGISY